MSRRTVVVALSVFVSLVGAAMSKAGVGGVAVHAVAVVLVRNDTSCAKARSCFKSRSSLSSDGESKSPIADGTHEADARATHRA